MPSTEEQVPTPRGNPRQRTLHEPISKLIKEPQVAPPAPDASSAPRQKLEQSETTQPLAVALPPAAAVPPPQQRSPLAVDELNRAVRQQQQAAASLAEQLARTTNPPKPIPVKIPNRYQPSPEARQAAQQVVAQAVTVLRQAAGSLHQRSAGGEQQLRQQLQETSSPLGVPAEWEALKSYLRAQLLLHPVAVSTHSDHPGQAARLVTYLRTQPPAEQLATLQRLAQGDPAIFRLAIHLYQGVLDLLADNPAPSGVAEILPTGYGDAEPEWDPFAEQYKRVLWALKDHPRTRIVTIMEIAETGLATRGLLDRACSERLVERGEIGTTGVYTLTDLGKQYLARTR